MTMKTCPRCEGRKYSEGFVTRGTRCGYETGIPCSLCKASGVVSDDTVRAFELGKELRQLRQDKDLSMMEIAPIYGIKIGDWSSLEHGRASKENVRAAIDWLRSYFKG